MRTPLILPLAILFALATPAGALALPAGALAAPELHSPSPVLAADDEPTDRSLLLASLGYQNGVRVEFTRDELSGDWGVQEDGQLDRNAPLLGQRLEGVLAAYLQITPRSVPVPRALLSEPPAGTPLPPELANRRITDEVVQIDGLTVPAPTTQATMGCWDIYYDPYHWVAYPGFPNPSSVFHQAKSYYSSSFGGMARYSNSYLANCGTGPARHRIYYKDFGVYKKHHDATINPGFWQAKHKGSVHRYRRVTYDAAAGDTRNGIYT